MHRIENQQANKIEVVTAYTSVAALQILEGLSPFS